MRPVAKGLICVLGHTRRWQSTANAPSPDARSLNTVCMFCDVSGFTALSEAMAKHGPEGAEHLARHLSKDGTRACHQSTLTSLPPLPPDSYMGQMIKIIASYGGSIFKFAGDAMLVLWPDYGDMELAARVQRAGQAALEVQAGLHKAELQVRGAG